MEKENTKEVISCEEKKQINVKLYPKYKMFSWDMLFYYAIIFLFFTQVKSISAADVLLAESFYPLFRAILLMPATAVIDKFGKRTSLIIGNSFIAVSTITYIFAQNFEMILLGQFFSAVGYAIKGICEANLLYDSLEKGEKRGTLFSKIDGRAASFYYYVDAITSIISGFLFTVNGYLPMIFCLLINILSIYMSTKFEEVKDVNVNEKIAIKDEISDLKKSLKSILASPRLRNLLLFGSAFSGILAVLVTLRSSILSDINVPAQYFGIIFAAFQIIAGISAKNQHRFHSKFRNKTLGRLAIPVVFSYIFIGIWCNIEFNYVVTLIGVLIAFLIQYISKGPFYTLIKQYMNNFTTSSLRTKISSIYNLMEGLLRSGISFFASFLLRNTTTANTFILSGCIFTIIVVLMLDSMRKKVGLKPEEYKEKDIKILELK